ncbi:MAG: YobA family protein [Bacillaceae bacterium]|nr:YobA family protein [Bacillaceae bacterium]
MKRVLSFILIVFWLSACGQQVEVNNSSPYKQEGIIGEITQTQNNRKQLLLIPNTDLEDISNKGGNELHRLAQEKDGAFYSFMSSDYNQLEVGMKVIVHWNGNQDDTDPPQRGADKIEIVSNK